MADLTICGAGIFGLSIAWNALARGASVTVIDPKGPGAGASGGIVGALQPHAPDPWNAKKQFQFESLISAERFWNDVDDASGLNSGYGRIGRLQPLLTERDVDLAKSRSEPAAKNWNNTATWKVVEQPMNGWCTTSPTGFFVHDTLSAILNPRRATESLAKAIKAKGGRIVETAALETPVIWATGWQGLLELSTSLGKTVGNGVKGQAVLLKHDAAGDPQLYVDGMHVMPHLDGTVAVGSTSEREFDDPDRTDAQLNALLERAIQQVPILKDARVLTRWAGVRPRASSRAPLLGPWPERPGHFIANGGFKIGFGMAPKCAEITCDLVLDGVDRIPESFHTTTLP